MASSPLPPETPNALNLGRFWSAAAYLAGMAWPPAPLVTHSYQSAANFAAMRHALGTLHVRHDERADRAVTNAVSKAHMTVIVLTRLYLLRFEQVAGWDVEPA